MPLRSTCIAGKRAAANAGAGAPASAVPTPSSAKLAIGSAVEREPRRGALEVAAAEIRADQMQQCPRDANSADDADRRTCDADRERLAE